MNPGFHTIAADRYHADDLAAVPSLSCGTVKALLYESPRKAWFGHPRLNKNYREEHDAKFDLGTAAHAVLLENDASKIVLVEADDWRTKAAKEQRGAAYAAGKTPMLSRQYDSVREMVDAALAFIEESSIADAWHAAMPEVTALWSEGPTWLRCRFDKLSQELAFIGDYKTTDSSVAPEQFSRQILRMGYHIQESFYRRIARELGLKDPTFVFLAQSVEPPYECSLHACDPALQAIADAEVDRAVRLWKECMFTGIWPSYGRQIHYALPTGYMISEHEQRVMEEA
jgi:hypothetical protein